MYFCFHHFFLNLFVLRFRLHICDSSLNGAGASRWYLYLFRYVILDVWLLRFYVIDRHPTEAIYHFSLYKSPFIYLFSEPPHLYVTGSNFFKDLSFRHIYVLTFWKHFSITDDVVLITKENIKKCCRKPLCMEAKHLFIYKVITVLPFVT